MQTIISILQGPAPLPNRVFLDMEYYQECGHLFPTAMLGHWWMHQKTVVIAQKTTWLPEDGSNRRYRTSELLEEQGVALIELTRETAFRTCPDQIRSVYRRRFGIRRNF